MEYSVPRRVVYQTEEPVPVSEVVQSLIANERIIQELKPFLEACVPGLVVEDIHTRKHIRGDVIVVSKRKDGGDFEPYMVHLIRLRD